MPAQREEPPPANALEARIAAAREELRELHEAGEVEWSDLSPLRVLEWIALDEPLGDDAVS